MTRRSVFSKLDLQAPTNQFNWSARHKEILAEYKANPFQHALALKPDETSADSNIPILQKDLTRKPLTVVQEKWLALANSWLLETDDNFVDYPARATEWDLIYMQCIGEKDSYDNAGRNISLRYREFNDRLAMKLFPKLSVSKKISFTAIQVKSKHLGANHIIWSHRSTLRYLQAFIHQLRMDNHSAYQDLYQRHSKLYPEVMAIFFCADAPYPYQSFQAHPQGWPSSRKALFINHTNSTQARIFTQAYHSSIGISNYETADLLPPLLQFIASCEQANSPELIIGLLDERQIWQEQNQILEVLEDFDHELYLDWVIKHSHYLEVAKTLSLWVKRHSMLTISKLILKLETDYQVRNSLPDFSTMTKHEIHEKYSDEKIYFDILEMECDYLSQILTHMCAYLNSTHPENFAHLEIVVAAQNLTHYTDVIAPIFMRASQVNFADDVTPLEQQHIDKNLAQVSKWLISPPWLYEPYYLQSPKLPEYITLALLPKPIFKSDGSELPLAQFENLMGILYQSDFEAWLTPLTDDDILQILSPFTRDSLNLLGRALWDIGICEPWGWLMNEDAVPFIHAYIFDNNNIRFFKKPSGLLVRMLVASIKLWYKINDSKGIRISDHVCSALEELFYQVDRGKAFFRDIAKAGCDEISAMTGYTLHELRHLAIPTLGFDGKSEQIFHLDAIAEKWLIVRLDAHLSPLLFDQTGTPLKSFPRAKKGDNKEHFKQVNKDIKALQRPLATLYKRLNIEFSKDLQIGIERSLRFMLNGLLQHPILRLYGQTLFWSLVKPKQFNRKKPNIIDTFIMTEDQVLMNVHYEEYSDEQIQQWLDEDYTVVLTHPDYLSVADYEAACEMLIDYGIAQPIKQMSLARRS